MFDIYIESVPTMRADVIKNKRIFGVKQIRIINIKRKIRNFKDFPPDVKSNKYIYHVQLE